MADKFVTKTLRWLWLLQGIGRKAAKKSYGGHTFMENRLLDAPAKGKVTQGTDS